MSVVRLPSVSENQNRRFDVMNTFTIATALIVIIFVVVSTKIRSCLEDPIARSIIDQWKSERASGLTDKKLSEFFLDKAKIMIKLAMDMRNGCHDLCHDDECDIHSIYGYRLDVKEHECHKPGCKGRFECS